MSDETASTGTVNAAEIARLAGVGRAAVSNWRRRHEDFPGPVGGTDTSPSFDLAEVRTWLEQQGKLRAGVTVESVWKLLDTARGELDSADAVAFAGAALLVASEFSDLRAVPDDELDRRIRAVFTGVSAADAPKLPSVHGYRAVLDDIARLAREQGDVQGTFERLYERYLTSVSRQFTASPGELAELMVDLVGSPGGTVLDPACGAGTLLRAAVHRGDGGNGAVRPLGQEVHPSLGRLGGIRLALAGADPDIRDGDSLRADAFPGVLADTVLVNPPFNQRDWGAEELEFDPRWEYGLPAKGDSELAWVQHALAHVRPGGAVAVVLPPGVASRRSGRRIRSNLLRGGALRTVVALPAGLAPPMGIPLMVWVLRRPVDGEPAPAEVLLVDAAGAVDAPDWPRVREMVLGAQAPFRAGTAQAAEEQGAWRVLPVADLLDEAVDVTPARHLSRVEHDYSGLTDVRADLAALASRLSGLLPEVFENSAGSGGRGGPQATVTVGELVRRGQVELIQAPPRRSAAETEADEPGPEAPLAFTAADVLSGEAPSHRAADEEGAVRLHPGDVLVPRIFSDRPAARVITDEDGEAFATGSVFVLRPDTEAVDPWFLAGVFTSSEVSRHASGTLRRASLLDVRRVELPRFPPAEQRNYGAAFRRLFVFDRTLTRLAQTGGEVRRTVTDGLVWGALRPAEAGVEWAGSEPGTAAEAETGSGGSYRSSGRRG